MNKDIIIKEFTKKYFADNNELSVETFVEMSDWLKSKLDQVETATLEKAKDITEDQEKFSSGQCPSCNNPRVSGYHPTDAQEHVSFYNAALHDVWERLDELTPSTNTNPVDEESKDECDGNCHCHLGNHICTHPMARGCIHCTNKGESK